MKDRNVNALEVEEEWRYNLDQQKTTVPRYQPDVPDFVQPRALKAHRRQARKIENAHPWRHFWLAPRHQGTHAPDSSDSEDDTPCRERILCRPPPPDHLGVDDGADANHPSLALQHQLTEKACPDVAPHSCRHCRGVAVDLRRQQAYEIIAADERNAAGWRLHPAPTGFTSDEALAAAADGCRFFSFVVRHLRGEDGQRRLDVVDGSEVTLTATMSTNGATAGVSIRWPAPDGRMRNQYHKMPIFHLYTVPGTKPLHESLGHWLPPNLVPDSPLAFTRARGWLEECDRDHPDCRRVLDRPYMPKRVLEIDAAGGVRLATGVPTAPYAALSYCWGGDQPAKTVRACLGAYAEAIALPTQPLTIRDALTVTRGLGLRYLWVDALCIVQDDDADKDEQIGQMYAVYRGAYVTISAATAARSADGFLSPRRRFAGFRLAARLADNVFGEVLAVPEATAGFYPDPQDGQYPLFSRGWTYQEHQLSPRILVYGQQETVFWCAASSHRDGSERRLWQRQLYPMRIFYLGQLAVAEGSRQEQQQQQQPQEQEEGNPLAGWADVVENYTSRELTVGDDKLPAVAAVAEKYARATAPNPIPATDYLAGLWRRDLAPHLLWRVWDPSKTSRPQRYRAPSWSWASLNGAIYPWNGAGGSTGGGGNATTALVVLAAETTPASTNVPFGSVRAGYVRVRARVRRVLWLNQNPDSKGGRRRRRYEEVDLCSGRDPAAPDDELALLAANWAGADPRLTLYVDVAADWPDAGAGTDVVLWSIEVLSCGEADDDLGEGGGLLLEQTSDAHVFRRVGQISVRAKGFMREPQWFNDRESEWREITIV